MDSPYAAGGKFNGKSMLQIASVATVFIYYVVTSLYSTLATGNDQEPEKPRPRSQRIASLVLTCLVDLLFVSEAAVAAYNGNPETGAVNGDVVYALFSGLTWFILLLGLIDSQNGARQYRFYGAWIIALIFQVVFIGFEIFNTSFNYGGRVAIFTIQSLRGIFLGILLINTYHTKIWDNSKDISDEENVPLLADTTHDDGSSNSAANGSATCNAYGTVPSKPSDSTDSNCEPIKDKNQSKDTKQKDSAEDSEEDDDDDHIGKFKKNWWIYLKAFKIFLPYMWPANNLRLQLHLPAIALCLVVERLLNVMLPLQLGRIVNILGKGASGIYIPVGAIAIYITLRLLSSGSGISLVRSILWLPIERYTTWRLKCAAYNHIMNLSCDFHDSKKSGRTWQTVQRGTSITELFHLLGFDLFPMAADLVIAVNVLWWLFGSYVAFVISLVVVLYFWVSAKSIPMKRNLQRKYIKEWESEYYQMTESTSNWSTVSYFSRNSYEMGRYKQKVDIAQQSIVNYQYFQYGVTAVRSCILLFGLTVIIFLLAREIVHGRRSVGDFVILITYWSQLSQPLHYFASGFGRIAQYLVDAEKLLVLLEKEPAVQDSEQAEPLVLKNGAVTFENVSFSYDGKRQVTNDISFHVPPGCRIALVGETGGGKSTILKLLFRFYDVTTGAILIDGQDIRNVTLQSLRTDIGVVPQDPALFNVTILENLQYAKLDATIEEVHNACRAVSLHDKIMSLTKGYATVVGERGVKLSGGELQRMAIARVILKDPKILLLDEATSSVDSTTESQIQASLEKLCANRTTFVIAHRLSTIIHADRVIVINEGRIVESGTHAELVKKSGPYNKLWTSQLKQQTGEAGNKSKSEARSKSPMKAISSLARSCDRSNSSCDPKSVQNQDDGTGTSHPAHQDSHRKDTEGEIKLDSKLTKTSQGEKRGRSPAKEVASAVRRRFSRSKSPREIEASDPDVISMSTQDLNNDSSCVTNGGQVDGDSIIKTPHLSSALGSANGKAVNLVPATLAGKNKCASSLTGIPEEGRNVRFLPKRRAGAEPSINGGTADGTNTQQTKIAESASQGFDDLNQETLGSKEDMGKAPVVEEDWIQLRKSLFTAGKKSFSEPLMQLDGHDESESGDSDQRPVSAVGSPRSGQYLSRLPASQRKPEESGAHDTRNKNGRNDESGLTIPQSLASASHSNNGKQDRVKEKASKVDTRVEKSFLLLEKWKKHRRGA